MSEGEPSKDFFFHPPPGSLVNLPTWPIYKLRSYCKYISFIKVIALFLLYEDKYVGICKC